MTEIAKHFDPSSVEEKWYSYWEGKGYFYSTPDDREPYTIVIPPPNVTGVLHMGHILNNTIQDVLIRKARLDGKNACWVPGTDHASIATEAKVVRKLREQGIKKSDLTRDEFMEHAWAWKEEYGGIILKQLRKLGASCDWKRTAFTMDEPRTESVLKVFVDLYKKGKLYRGLRMVNWDPEAQTVLSNEEVLHAEENSHLYHVKYAIEGIDDFLTVATKRPETIMGDTAVAVHPDDEKYAHLKGKRAIVPLVNRSVPIIFDDYVDMEFGTGALKVTPAHDPNDYEIGKRHNLEVIDTINDNGTMAEAAQIHIGEDRFAARKLVTADLDAAGLLIKKEEYRSSIGRSERTNAVVEPKLSLQWYVDMKKIADPALRAVMEDDIIFHPKKYKTTYRIWMENIRDWCISRQLWWGQRVPAWYYEDKVYVAETAEEALAQAQAENSSLTMADLKQDEDVLDTWFSSWLWPISTFHGFQNSEEIDYYYPTNALVTGWDIIFFWVARMIMSGYEWKDDMPFKHVYFTGMVRDKQKRKMSKSLGNSPDALKLIADYGADGVRYGMLSCSPAGGDLLFDEKLVETGKNFCNKIWNALRLVKSFQLEDKPSSKVDELAIVWFENKFLQIVELVEKEMAQFRLSEALTSLYSFIWGDFCSWYLEMIKPEYGGSLSQTTYDKTLDIFEKLMVTLHPYMPFITEEVWSSLKERKDGEDCIVSQFPKTAPYDSEMIKQVNSLTDLVSSIRDLRNKNGMSPKEAVELKVEKSGSSDALFALNGAGEMVTKMSNLSSLESVNADQELANGISFLSGNDKYIAIIEKEIDVEAEKENIEKEIDYQKGFLASVEKKLSNERFVSNAPEAVVNNEKKKLADGQDRLRILEENLAKLN